MAVANLVMLAVNQNQCEMALELCSHLVNQKGALYGNLKALALSHLGRFAEAISTIETLLEGKDAMENPFRIYPITIRSLREKVEAATDKTKKDKVEELSKKIISSNRLATTDLLEQSLKVEAVRMGIKQQGGMGMGRQQGNNFNNRFVYNNNNSNDGGFNRGPRQFNQEGGGFNRGPRQFNQEDGGFNRIPRQFNQEGGGRFDRLPPRTERARSQPPRKFDEEDD